MNRTIEYYKALPYRMEVIPDMKEGGFTAWYPDLPGCLSCGETMADAVMNALEAKDVWLAAALEDGVEIADPTTEPDLSEYSGQFKLRLPKSLHKSLSEQAKKEGTSMNQYCIYLLSQNNASHIAAAV